MSTENQLPELDPELKAQMPSELDTLKHQATLMGITFAPNVTVKTLKAKIQQKLKEEEHQVEPENVPIVSEEDAKAAELVRLKKENLALVRVIVTPMCPTKRDLQGDIFSVSNAVLGTVKKYIPYNVEWHVPAILLKMLKRKQLQTFVNKKTPGGKFVKEPKIIPAYQITELPPLSKEELEDLKKSQLVRNATKD